MLSSFQMVIAIVLAVTAVTLLIYICFFRSPDALYEQGIRGPRQYPLVGSLFLLMKLGVVKFDKMCKEKYGNLVRETGFGARTLFVFDVEMLKEILIKEHSSFTDHYSSMKLPKPFDRGMTALKGDDWRRVRHAVSPTFTSGKLKKMTYLIAHSVKILKEKFEEAATENKDIDLKDICGRYTMCVIAETMFGIRIDAMRDQNDVFMENSKKISKLPPLRLILILASLLPGLKTILPKLFGKYMFSDGLMFMVKVVEEAIKERRGKEDEYHDFLSLMLKSEITEDDVESSGTKSRGLTNAEIISQAVIFMLAGNETTATAMMYLSYLLAINPEIQEQCRKEILDLSDDNPEAIYESVSKMALLDGCLKEALRLYPPAPRTDRVANQDVVIGNVRIPKGTAIVVPIAQVLRDPSLWEDPETFNPNRYSDGDGSEFGKVPFQFLTFGNGPRNCIGMRFATLEIKLAMATILRHFRLVVCENTPREPLQFGLREFADPKVPIVVRAEKLDEDSA